eukprot:scaffold17080_cov140-Cylindrotheca_fusiformis.AAC.1
MGVPRFQTHMLTSFVARVWLEVEFRFLANEIVKFVFQNMLIHNKSFKNKDLDYDDEFFGMSIRILNNCKERRMGFHVLCNMCLALGKMQLVFQYSRELKMFWDDRYSRAMPGRFRDFAAEKAGHTAVDEKLKKMQEVGTFGASLKDAWDVYCNGLKQRTVSPRLLSNKRRKVSNAIESSRHKSDTDDAETAEISGGTLSRRGQSNVLRMGPVAPKKKCLPCPPGSLSLSDLLTRSQSRNSITSNDRAVSTQIETNTTSVDAESGTRPPRTHAESQQSKMSLSPQEEDKTCASLVPKSRPAISSLMELALNKDRLKSLDLATSEELDCRVHSELVVQHPNKVYHLGLSPFEVYSAGDLASFSHKRVVNNHKHKGDPCASQFSETERLS